jgi:hypothetical protein
LTEVKHDHVEQLLRTGVSALYGALHLTNRFDGIPLFAA